MKQQKNKHIYLGYFLLSLLITTTIHNAETITFRIKNNPTTGTLFFQLFNGKDSFSQLSSPYNTQSFPVSPTALYHLSDISPGQYALLVFWDKNGNNQLDRTFIGIPKEPTAFSNEYTPKGPPRFDKAAFIVTPSDNKTRLISLPSTRRRNIAPQWGIGFGSIINTSLYTDNSDIKYRFMPAISYLGDRIQILGPNIFLGITQKGPFKLRSVLQFRFGRYNESDSPSLAGLGSRSHTVMGGISGSIRIVKKGSASVSYSHDLGNIHGGAILSSKLDYTVQAGSLSMTPQLKVNYLSSNIAAYEYGVPVEKEKTSRAAYNPGTSVIFTPGISTRIMISDKWSLSSQINWNIVDRSISNSPIVKRSSSLSSILFLSYIF